MLKLFIAIFLYSTILLGDTWVDKRQFINLLDFHKNVETVMKETTEDGETKSKYELFRRYLYGIFPRESSYGLYSYSDTEEDKFYYLHKKSEVYISRDDYEKAKFYKGKKVKYISVKYWGKTFKKKIRIKKGVLKPIVEASIGPLMIRVGTARYIIKKKKIKKWYYLLNNDKEIVNKLLNDTKFSIYLTLYYMDMNYKIAVKRKYTKPLERTVGRHNGTWHNFKYAREVEEWIGYTIKVVDKNRYNIDILSYIKQ